MKKKLAALGAISTLAASARAELPAAVATAIGDYQADTTEAIGMVIAAGVVVWALWRLGKKLGWM